MGKGFYVPHPRLLIPQQEIIVLPLETAVKVKWKDACQEIAIGFDRAPDKERQWCALGPL